MMEDKALKRCRRWIFILTFVFFAGCMAAVLFMGVRSMNATIQTMSDADEGPSDVNPVDAFRTARQQLRSLQKAQLNDVAHNSEKDADLSGMAKRQLMDLCAREEQELNLEGMLAIRGYQSPLVMVQPDSVNVLISAEIITQQDSGLILEMVCRETGMESGNVKIIPIN